jgi:hypothetical protein
VCLYNAKSQNLFRIRSLQITAPFTSAFVYDDFKCERDVGFTLDAVIYDLCHGGNIKSRGVANSLIGGLSEGETEAYPGLAIESDESVAAYNYMLTVVEMF